MIKVSRHMLEISGHTPEMRANMEVFKRKA